MFCWGGQPAHTPRPLKSCARCPEHLRQRSATVGVERQPETAIDPASRKNIGLSFIVETVRPGSA